MDSIFRGLAGVYASQEVFIIKLTVYMQKRGIAWNDVPRLKIFKFITLVENTVIAVGSKCYHT